MDWFAIPKGLGKFIVTGISRFFSWDFLFGIGLTWGTKLFRFYGMVAFLSTLFIALNVGINTPGTIHEKIIAILIELVKTIVGVDQYIYELSIKFNQIAQPTLYQGIWTFLLILKKSFFYIWWHRVFSWIIRNMSWVFPFNLILSLFIPKEELERIDESTVGSKISWWAFKMLYFFIIVANIISMTLITKEIQVTWLPIRPLVGKAKFDVLLSNIFNLLNELIAKNWWHWIIAFKGLLHYIFTGALFKTFGLLTGTKIYQNISNNITQNVSN